MKIFYINLLFILGHAIEEMFKRKFSQPDSLVPGGGGNFSPPRTGALEGCDERGFEKKLFFVIFIFRVSPSFRDLSMWGALLILLGWIDNKSNTRSSQHINLADCRHKKHTWTNHILLFNLCSFSFLFQMLVKVDKRNVKVKGVSPLFKSDSQKGTSTVIANDANHKVS